MRNLKKFAAFVLAMVMAFAMMASAAYAAPNGVTYSFEADGAKDGVVYVAPGESVSIRVRVKGTDKILVMQDVVPYDDELFDAQTDAYAASQIQLDLGKQCINMMHAAEDSSGDGFVATEFVLTPKAGVTTGEVTLTHVMAMAFNTDKVELPVDSSSTLTVKIGEEPNKPVEHKHSYSTDWTTDATSHWHVCNSKTGTCNAPEGSKAAHTSDGGKVTTAATATRTGIRTYSCSVCGRVLRTETIPATGNSGNSGNTGNTGNTGNIGTTRPTNPPTTITDPTTPLAGGSLPFVDVKKGDWFYGNVYYVYWQKLMNGTSATTFEPYSNTTRAMMATVIYRMENSPKTTFKGTFTDVKSGEWYSDAIEWCAAHGIVDGYGKGLFGPHDNVTREQLATMLVRYAKYKNYDVSGRAALTAFGDNAKVSNWAKDGVQWAVANKIIQGDNGNLRPGNTATRAEIAAMFNRFCDKFAKMPELKPIA